MTTGVDGMEQMQAPDARLINNLDEWISGTLLKGSFAFGQKPMTACITCFSLLFFFSSLHHCCCLFGITIKELLRLAATTIRNNYEFFWPKF